MILTNSQTAVTLPNPDWGYTSTIDMAIDVIERADGKISAWDNGISHDKKTCKCVVYLSESEYDDFYEIYNGTERDEAINLVDNDGGFFPFSPAYDNGLTGYTVYLDKIADMGMVDSLGKRFGVEFELINAGALTQNVIVTYRKEGHLQVGSFADLRFPNGGFGPKIEQAMNHTYAGGTTVRGLIRGTGNDIKNSNFTLTANENACAKVCYYIHNTARASQWSITGGDKYFFFGLSEQGNEPFTVRLLSGKLKIKAVRSNEYDIEMEINKNA